jgi:excisionase family DNA binding protein
MQFGAAMIDLEKSEYLTTSQAGRLLDLSAERVRQMIATGRLTAWPTPLGRLIQRRDVEALAAERKAREASR